MIDVSLILFILFDYLRIPWNPIKSNHAKIKRKRGHFITVVLRAAVILNMTTVEDNYVRYSSIVRISKKIPQSNSRILESQSYSKQQYNPRDPRDSPPINQSHWDPTAVT